jgi:hypothetical protein
MKTSYFSVLFLAVLATSALARAGEFSPPEACLEAYAASTDPAVQAASRFLSDAANDFDYESMDQMSAAIRAAKGLAPWTREDVLDELNVDISYALDLSVAQVCAPKALLTLSQIQNLLIRKALPAYYATDPRAASSVGWK